MVDNKAIDIGDQMSSEPGSVQDNIISSQLSVLECRHLDIPDIHDEFLSCLFL